MARAPFKLKSQGSSFKMMGSSPVKSDEARKAYRKAFGTRYDKSTDHYKNFIINFDKEQAIKNAEIEKKNLRLEEMGLKPGSTEEDYIALQRAKHLEKYGVEAPE